MDFVIGIMKARSWQVLYLLVVAATPRPIASATVRLQSAHEVLTPGQRLQALADLCEREGIDEWDMYGDFHKTEEDSFLRKFESDLAKEFGKEAAVFFPSGVMAQSAALLIHQQEGRNSFACHATSHLLIHEQEGYKKLCDFDAVVLPTIQDTDDAGIGFGMPPLLYDHIKDSNLEDVSTLILELPHRELGGKITPWEDVEKISRHLKSAGIAFHCDGARIFEATAGYKKSVSELAKPFDSVYISFYKGLGGLSGAMLLGSHEFCDEARLWLRRFGGNLYTWIPYIVSAWSGYQNNHVRKTSNNLSFQDKKDKLVRLAGIFASDDSIRQVLALEPSTPQVNMVHCYLRPSMDICKKVCQDIEQQTGVCLFERIRPLAESDPGINQGYKCKLELSIGEANGQIADHVWLDAWSEFSSTILQLMGEV